MQPPLITSNETIQNTTINGVIKKFSRANRAATGATALVLVLIGFMFFLLFCYVLGRCAGRTSDKEGNSKRSRRRGKRNNLDLTEQQRRQNEVLHQKRIYEIQHEEGLHNMPPSLDEISDEDLVVPLPGAVAHSKSSDLENGNCLPHVALAESKSDGKVNHEITNDTQSKPKNKAVELLMRKVTTVEVPKSAINVIHKKEMIQKRIAAEAAKRAEEEASATLVMA
uniref:Uncharacterized protein n=1 Tax=Rhabditophanes sp. KR3021 TaxID=114890 RepID=A0AC35UB42_9BILA